MRVRLWKGGLPPIITAAYFRHLMESRFFIIKCSFEKNHNEKYTFFYNKTFITKSSQWKIKFVWTIKAVRNSVRELLLSPLSLFRSFFFNRTINTVLIALVSIKSNPRTSYSATKTVCICKCWNGLWVTERDYILCVLHQLHLHIS